MKSEEAKVETYRSQYPGGLHFDFTWDEKKGKELGLQQIWHDDKFTYLRGQFQETPALYELKDGKGSLTIVLLAQALPSASSGVDWLYQFTDNLTNLTDTECGVIGCSANLGARVQNDERIPDWHSASVQS